MTFDRTNLSERLIQDFIDEHSGVEEEKSGRKLRYLLPMLIIAVLGFISYGWYYDKFAISSTEEIAVPLLKAAVKPVRIKPEDPGGMVVANRDKSVYDTISSSKSKNLPVVTRLAPRPETPVAREIIGKEQNLDVILGDIADNMPGGKNNKNKWLAPREKADRDKNNVENMLIVRADIKNIRDADQAKKIVKKLELAAEDLTVEEPKNRRRARNPRIRQKISRKPQKNKATIADLKMAPTPKTRQHKLAIPAKKPQKGYKIQLGSFKSENDVAVSWRKIRKKFPGIVGNLSYYTEKADLGKKGVFYRLKVGPIKKEAKARKICQDLRDKKQGCLFVKR